MTDQSQIREHVAAHYGKAARQVMEGDGSPCCGGSAAEPKDPITRDLYGTEQAKLVPQDALAASHGCGNPTALIDLRPGQVVLDLGSGGGIDVLLSARRVGPTGKAYGLDMTDDMLALARANQEAAGLTNVEFLKGTIEHIPLPDRSVDVVISNCVINLSVDKDRVLREAFRVLKPGGRFAVSDIVLRRPLPWALRQSVELWAGCVAGALEEREYRDKLAGAGFAEITVTVTREYQRADLASLAGGCCGGGPVPDLSELEGVLVSAFVRAVRPAAAT